MSKGEKKFFLVGLVISIVLAIVMTIAAGDHVSSMVGTTFQERLQDMKQALFN